MLAMKKLAPTDYVPASNVTKTLILAGIIVLFFAIKWQQAESKVEAIQTEYCEVSGEPTPEQAELLDTEHKPVAQASLFSGIGAKRTSAWVKEDGKPDLFRIVMTETKRREAMGRPGKELARYKDGKEWAIGYGNHIKYLDEHWTAIVKRQNYKLTETQARELMYLTFHRLDAEIKRDLPRLNEGQRWAVKSLAFNWGYGNIKRSKLYPLLKKGTTGPQVERAWMRCHAGTENHRQTRRMEVAMWNGDYKAATQTAKEAFNAIERRGDFKHYN